MFLNKAHGGGGGIITSIQLMILYSVHVQLFAEEMVNNLTFPHQTKDWMLI